MPHSDGHPLIADSRFYQFLFHIDQQIAAEVQGADCPECGGPLHVANYPRKPRGLRELLDESWRIRLSLCCGREGCRRRCTPPSVRFLGRKVYLGVVMILVTAMNHGLTPRRRRQLIDQLDLWPQTIARWRRWWRDVFVHSRCWRGERGRFIPPVGENGLPGALLGRLIGTDLRDRLCLVLRLVGPLTTGYCSNCLL
ncbi:MAG: hypothetical protein U9R74_02315 [Pseudomonadota bacterium]|nr:hypothetical protein [Pseudomonadota bacterium]